MSILESLRRVVKPERAAVVIVPVPVPVRDDDMPRKMTLAEYEAACRELARPTMEAAWRAYLLR